MKVYLASIYDYEGLCDPPRWLVEKNNVVDVFVTEDPSAANVILFAESHPGDDPYFRNVFRHPLYKKFRRKCVLYHDADFSITPMPTISPSLETWQYNPKYNRAAHYIARSEENKNLDNHLVNYKPVRSYLYSFIGANNNSVRASILAMPHPQDSFIKDSTGINAWELEANEKYQFKQKFIEISDDSFFVLCPRGIGVSSYRLFETMQMGRVPVIIADNWIKIKGVNWNECAIIVPEKDIATLPFLLQSKKEEAVEMGKNARCYWEEYFSPEKSLYHLSKAAMEIVVHEYGLTAAIRDYSYFFRKGRHFRNYLRYLKNRLKSNF